DLLYAVGLHRRAQAELQRAAPEVRHQVTAQVATRLAKHRQESQVLRRRGGLGQGGSSCGSGRLVNRGSRFFSPPLGRGEGAAAPGTDTSYQSGDQGKDLYPSPQLPLPIRARPPPVLSPALRLSRTANPNLPV